MFCKKKLFNKFFLFSIMFLLLTVCFRSLVFPCASVEAKPDMTIIDPPQAVQVQQREIIHSLKRMEHRALERRAKK